MKPSYVVLLLRKWDRVAAILACLAGVALVSYQTSLGWIMVDPNSLAALPLAGHQRLLILAPHCDDETLGTGGLIQAAEQAGLQVRVVIATNGDGYFFATAQEFHRVYPHQLDYVNMGELRQRESLAALAVLGVGPDQVSFLSYPDRGTPALWNERWSPDQPYRSPYSGDTRSPYALTYDPNSVYAGADYLGDLESILKAYRPDLIVYPHPEDVHPDHWGLNAFARLAIALTERADPTFRPAQFTYLIHRPDFPVVKGLRPQQALTPPIALYEASPAWLRLDLPAQEVALKAQAVGQYRSQLPLLRGLMESFIRRDELFAPVVDAKLTALTAGNPLDPAGWAGAGGQAIAPVQRDPVGDILTHNTLPATDLVAIYAARGTDGNLWVCSQSREEIGGEVTVAIRLKALSTQGILAYSAETGTPQTGWHLARRSGVYACLDVPLNELGNPWAVYLAASSEGLDRVTLDQTGWQMVDVPQP